MEELIPMAYPRRYSSASPSSSSQSDIQPKMDLHDLALLLMVFASGAAADLTLPPYNPEAERYRQLSRAALGLKSVFEEASLSAVQCICLLASYDIVAVRKNSMESAWKTLSLALSLGSSVSGYSRRLTVRVFMFMM